MLLYLTRFISPGTIRTSFKVLEHLPPPFEMLWDKQLRLGYSSIFAEVDIRSTVWYLHNENTVGQ